MSRIQINSFLALVNDRLLGGKALDAITKLWAEHTHYDACESKVLSGKRQGEACGKPVIKGKTTCLCHQPRQAKIEENKIKCTEHLATGKACPRFCVEDGKCQFHLDFVAPTMCNKILVGGPRKGQVCAKICKKGDFSCTAHKIVESEQVHEEVQEPARTEVEAPEIQTQAPARTEVEAPVIEIEAGEAILCSAILKSGAHKGSQCSKKCVEGKSTCASHKK